MLCLPWCGDCRVGPCLTQCTDCLSLRVTLAAGNRAGDADSSELMRRISSDDESERMPPEGKPLSDRGDQPYPPVDRRRGELGKALGLRADNLGQRSPEVQQADWVRNDVDRFILSVWKLPGLQPAKPAAKKVLARRFITISLVFRRLLTTRRVSCRRPARRLRTAGRYPACFAPLRREVGPALARRCSLRRVQQLRTRQS